MKRLGLGSILTAVIAAIGCGGAKAPGSDQIVCRGNAQCGTDSVCIAGACVPPAAARTWAVEIVPGPPVADTTDGGPPAIVPATLTELTDVPFGADVAQLTAAESTGLSIGFTFNNAAPVPANANVVLTVPPGIPGRPDLLFEAAMAGGKPVTLSLPTPIADRPGTVQLLPWPSETLPPCSFAASRLGDQPLTFPAGNIVWVRGTLHDIEDLPLPENSFVARAFQDDTLVSNSVIVANDGTFSLAVSATSAAAAPVTIAFVPKNNSATSSDPSFRSTAVMLPLTSFDVTLPALAATPQYFGLPLLTNESTSPPEGTVVRATTTLPLNPPPSAPGQATFTAEATTGPDGIARLALLPGTPTKIRSYAVTVSPPAGALFATACRGDVAVASGNSDPKTPALLPGLPLTRRPVISGTVVTDTGRAVANVVLTATLLAPDDPACPPRYESASTTTDLQGLFSLPLDPGHYRLDYDPPAGAPIPRLTEPDVHVAADLTRQVQLDPAGFIEGDVHGPDGAPLPMATIRIYQVRCSGADDCFGPNRTAPWFRARVQSNSSGHFRAVVPRL